MSYKSGLPEAVAFKIYKTGTTRGADKDTIWQNRVSRTSTVLIPLGFWGRKGIVPAAGFAYGYIVLAKPSEYFSDRPPAPRKLHPDLKLGTNLLVVYETRKEWVEYSPEKYGWKPATSRLAPLGGQYIARVPDTTRDADTQIRHGFAGKDSGGQGAGIRVYEYASPEEITATRLQLAFLAWRTHGIFELAKREGTADPEKHKAAIDDACNALKLDDIERLREQRIVNRDGEAVCPLCQKVISANELASRVEQAEGREVADLTITSANLFHVRELRVGEYNHCRYNLGWGHHHCNTVARDVGIPATLKWMEEVIAANKKRG